MLRVHFAAFRAACAAPRGAAALVRALNRPRRRKLLGAMTSWQQRAVHQELVRAERATTREGFLGLEIAVADLSYRT